MAATVFPELSHVQHSTGAVAKVRHSLQLAEMEPVGKEGGLQMQPTGANFASLQSASTLHSCLPC